MCFNTEVAVFHASPGAPLTGALLTYAQVLSKASARETYLIVRSAPQWRDRITTMHTPVVSVIWDVVHHVTDLSKADSESRCSQSL